MSCTSRSAPTATRSTRAGRSSWTPVDASSASSAGWPRVACTQRKPGPHSRSMSPGPAAGAPTTPAELNGRGEVVPGGGEDSELDLEAQRDAPVGGQAVLEGVMMRGVAHWAVAVRKPSAEQLSEGGLTPEEAALGEIAVSSFPLDSAMRRHRLLRLPIVRGVVALGGSMAIGFRALEVSANAQLPPEEGAGGGDGEGESQEISRGMWV